MQNDKGAKLFLQRFPNNIMWTLHYKGQMKKWYVSGSMNTSVKLWKDRGFKVVESF